RLVRGADDFAAYMMSAPRLPLPLFFLMIHCCRLSAAMPCIPCNRKAQSPFALGAACKGLSFLAPNLLVLVANSLALVRLGFANAPDLSGELTHALLIRAANYDRRRVGQFDRNAVGRQHLNGIGVAYCEHELLLVYARLIADSFYLQLLFESFRNSFDHVGNQTAGQAVQCPIQALIIGT